MTTFSTTPNGTGRGPDGKFTVANVAAKRHGLRAHSKLELRKRNRRVGQLATRLSTAFADVGRPLDPLSLPLAWKWAECESRRVDLFAALKVDPSNQKHHDQWLATMRTQIAIERQLGMTPALGQDLRAGELDPVLEVQRLRLASNNHE